MCMLERDATAIFSAFAARASLKTANNFALTRLFCSENILDVRYGVPDPADLEHRDTINDMES